MTTKSIIAKNAACNAIVDLIDTGTTYSSGYLNIYKSDSTKIAGLRLSNPAFGIASDGTATANSITDGVALIDGTASSFSFVNRDASAIWSGSVTVSGGGGDMELISVSIPQDSTISIVSAVYIVPA